MYCKIAWKDWMILEISKKVFETFCGSFWGNRRHCQRLAPLTFDICLKAKICSGKQCILKESKNFPNTITIKPVGVNDENSLQRHSRSRLFCDDSFQPRLYSPLSDNPCVNTHGSHPPTGIWPLRPPPTVIRKLVAHNRRGKGSARGRKGSLCLQQPANTGQCVSIQRRILFLAFTQLSMHVWHILSKMGTRQFFHLLAI